MSHVQFTLVLLIKITAEMAGCGRGSTRVDPDLEEIVIQFSRPMSAGYSFVGGGPKYPETLGKPVYSDDQKTITLRVRLKPEWEYEFWLNRGNYMSFRSQEGVPLKSVHVQFKTSD